MLKFEFYTSALFHLVAWLGDATWQDTSTSFPAELIEQHWIFRKYDKNRRMTSLARAWRREQAIQNKNVIMVPFN